VLVRYAVGVMTAPRRTGPWSPDEITTFLDTQRIPLRLACRTTSGWPLVASHWFLWRDGALWCATQADAKIVRYLAAEPRCGFEVAPDGMPYRGVRGQGRAAIEPAQGVAVLRDLVQRYLGDESSDFARWLLARSATEVAIRIEPIRMRSWDFGRRMGG
jgi:hypothetical protein